MKCESCSAIINPKWKHAIESNLCPFCGASIMDAGLKQLLSTLSSTIEQLTNFPEHLEDWLHTHGYVREDKIPKIPIVSETAVVPQIKQPPTDGTISVQNQEVTNKFFKNAEATKIVSKTQSLKDKVAHIKKQGAASLTADPLGGMIDPEDLNTADPLVVADLQEIIGTSQEIASSLPGSADEGEEDIHPIALAMAGMAGNKGQSNAKDLMKLQQLQDKTRSARNRMLSGSSGKGSFSRS